MRCLIEFANNSLSVVGATQILPTALRDLIFMPWLLWYGIDKRWWMHKAMRGDKLNVYGVYCCIKSRCNTVGNTQYKNYGWRGIKCKWTTFRWFYRDMWPSYKKGLSIDRIDNNWNYCKKNCRWADIFTQNNNKSNNIRVDWWLTLAQWCRKKEMSIFYTTAMKYFKRGDSLEYIEMRYKKYCSDKLKRLECQEKWRQYLL